MIAKLLSKTKGSRVSKSVRKRNPKPAKRLRFDNLEQRQLLTTIPGLPEPPSAPLPVFAKHFEKQDWSDSTKDTKRLRLHSMMNTNVFGRLDRADVDTTKVRLARGQLLTVQYNPISGGSEDTQLQLLDRRGRVIETADQNSTGPSLAFRTNRPGTFYISVSASNTTGKSYVLDVRPIGKHGGKVSPKLLNVEGDSVYAVPNETGSSLALVGPSGYGFELLGKWRQRVAGNGENTRSVFSVSKRVTLRSEIGDLTMPLPSRTKFRVSTAPGQFGEHFGEVRRIDWAADLGIGEVALPFKQQFGLSLFGDNVQTPQLGWGVNLGGDQILERTGAPLNPAVPYMHVTFDSDFAAKFGNVKLNAGLGLGAAVIFDPADPFLYVGAKAPVGELAFAGSAKGQIPFTAANQPENYQDDLYGNLFFRGGATLPTPIPMPISGDLTWDFDANDDGNAFGGRGMVKRLVTGKISGPELLDLARDMKVGVNGELSVGLTKDNKSNKSGNKSSSGSSSKSDSGSNSNGDGGVTLQAGLSIPVADASVIVDGQSGVYYRGGSVNAFEDTVLEPLIPASLAVDGFHLWNGDYSIEAEGVMKLLDHELQKNTLVFDNDGIHARGELDAGFLTAQVTGDVLYNGEFNFEGEGELNAGPFGSLQASFDIDNQKIAADATLDTPIVDVDLSGIVQANGQFDLQGSGELDLGAFGVSTADFQFNNQRLHAGFDLNLLGSNVNFTGDVQASGKFDFSGSANVNLGPVGQALGNFKFGNSGITVSAGVNALGSRINLSGALAANGNFSLKGSISANFSIKNPIRGLAKLVDVKGSTAVTLTNSSFKGKLSSDGKFLGFGGGIDVSMNLSSSGKASSGSGTVKIHGVPAPTLSNPFRTKTVSAGVSVKSSKLCFTLISNDICIPL